MPDKKHHIYTEEIITIMIITKNVGTILIIKVITIKLVTIKIMKIKTCLRHMKIVKLLTAIILKHVKRLDYMLKPVKSCKINTPEKHVD